MFYNSNFHIRKEPLPSPFCAAFIVLRKGLTITVVVI